MEIITVWKQVTPELKAELLAMWQRNGAMRDPVQAASRAQQAVCVGRDELLHLAPVVDGNPPDLSLLGQEISGEISGQLGGLLGGFLHERKP